MTCRLGPDRRRQRDWRSQGLLQAREAGRASFSPRELAEMRVMVKLRGLGLPLPEARSAAEDAAPGVIFAALANHPKMALAVDAPPDQAADYLKMLEQESDAGYLQILADLPEMKQAYRYAVIERGKCSLLPTLGEDSVDVRSNSELRGRTSGIDVGFWTLEELAEIATRGFAALGYTITDIDAQRFGVEACRSPQLMQQICLQACRVVGIKEARASDAPLNFAPLSFSANATREALEIAASQTDYT